MQPLYGPSWVDCQVEQTAQIWQQCSRHPPRAPSAFDRKEQRRREKAYDQAMHAVEREARRKPARSSAAGKRERVVQAFAQFSAVALRLSPHAISMLTDEFLPVGTALAAWARRFDDELTRAEITQACRNAWTACGMQPLFGRSIQLTPAILAYSLLYPYSDNFLDRNDIGTQAKLRFSARFRDRLLGHPGPPMDRREAALSTLVGLIEQQYPRRTFPDVYECLLAIHQSQEASIVQQGGRSGHDPLRISCAKGGTSVLADACLAYGSLTEQESRFAFEWGVLLQLGDDLQDIREDLASGSMTLFSSTAREGRPLDHLVTQLLAFSDNVGDRMDRLPHGTPAFKDLLRMSWHSLIVRAVAESDEYFSAGFLRKLESQSPFRFAFLRSRNQRLAGRRGLYSRLFDAFLEDSQDANADLPLPCIRLEYQGESALELSTVR